MPNKQPEAVIDVLFHCGCGFKADQLSDAREHVEATGHKLEFHGTIKPKE